MKIVTDMNAKEARKFFLKPESYHTFDLPFYFNFECILDLSDNLLKGKDFLNSIVRGRQYLPKKMDKVDYVIVHNKDGKYAWRPFELIHPILYVKLVNDICELSNWKTIKKRLKSMHSNKNIVCCSMPGESNKKNNDKKDIIMKWWTEYEQESISNFLEFSLMTQTDITNCYPSIYTHVICWALHGKELSKEIINNNDYIGRVIDLDIQQMQYGQTNGIPQGSVLMDFIAEIVLGYCDEELTKKLIEQNISDYKILRYRDDYRIFTNDSKTEELILKSLTEVLSDNNLRLNISKTFSTSDIVIKSLKEDKIDRFINMDSISKYKLYKQLFLIDEFSKRHVNSGSLVVLLTDIFNKKVLHMKRKPEKYKQIISILVDIMYNNPRTFPICVAILSHVLKLIKNEDEIKKNIDLILNKFKTLPNTIYLEIWLQRITIPIDRNIKYSENSICEKVYNRNTRIWNSDWLRENVKKKFDENLIINEKEIKKLSIGITKDEVTSFSIFHES